MKGKGNMKTFYIVTIKRVYEEIDFRFERYDRMTSFLKNVIDNVIETFRSIMNTNEKIVNFITTDRSIQSYNH